MKKKLINVIMTAIKRWNEYLPLLIAFIVWILAGPIIRFFSPAAGIDDAGLIQALLFGLVLYFAAAAFSWFALRIVFPDVGKFVDDELGKLFYSASNNNKIWYALTLFAVYFFGAIIILAFSI